MSDEDQENLDNLFKLGVLAELAEELEDAEEEERAKRRVWVKDWIGRRKQHIPLFNELASEDKEKFFADFRLYPEDFDQLLSRYNIAIYLVL
jgi:hypothetical protein